MCNFEFFQNRKCEYFPCHEGANPETFNCLFCYCPLYCLGENCGGQFRYTDAGFKDCSKCLRPHRQEYYSTIYEKMGEVLELVRKK